MRVSKAQMLLYLVTDRSWLPEGESLLAHTEDALKAGVTFLQLREKRLSDADFLAEAQAMRTLANRHRVPFVINDNVQVALASGADGVHVGQEDMQVQDVRALLGPEKMLGVSAHTVQEALLAEKQGADYLGVGAVFSTSTKTDVETLPFETLREICAAVRIPVVAIGGIGSENLMQLRGSGVDGVAVISAIYAAPDRYAAAAALLARAKEMVSG